MSKRYLMWTLFAFLIACFLYSFIPSVSVIALLITGTVTVAAFIIFRIPGRKLVVPCVASFCIGILFFACYHRGTLRFQDQLLDREVEIHGTVEELGTNSAGDLTRYRINVKQIGNQPLRFYQTVKVYLYTEPAVEATPGDSFRGTVSFFETPVEYGKGREDGVVVSAYLSDDGAYFNPTAKNTFAKQLYRYRTAIQSKLSFGKEETLGLLRSVCFGDKTALDSGLRVSLRRLGLSHVTAVSGLHLSFAVMIFNLLFSMIGFHYRLRHSLNILVAVGFTALVGFPPSCIRACIMLGVYSLGVALGLLSDALTSLSFASFLIVLLSPSSIRDVGFILSVSATAGILLLYSPLENFMFPKKISKKFKINNVYRKFTGIFACSFAATVATLPAILLCFGAVSLIGPLANVILILPLQALFMLGMVMVLLGWIPFIGPAVGFLCDVLYWIVKSLAAPMGRLFFSSVSVLPLCGVLLLIVFLAICGVSLYHYIRYQKRSFIALLLVFLCFCAAFGGVVAVSKGEEVRIAFIDVGQGDCTVISKGERAVVFDYGGDSQSRYHLIDYFERNNIYIVEMLAFTHLHSDHTNGLRTLLQNVYVDLIVYPDLEADDPQLVTAIQKENHAVISGNCSYTVLDNLQIEVLAEHAVMDSASKQNENSVCYRITCGDISTLITGDIGMYSESLLLNCSQPDSTLLKVAHHGSNTSSFYPFLKAVSPQIAIISVGENNYGLPDENVIDRLKTLCPAVLTTENGNIVYRTDGKLLERISS